MMQAGVCLRRDTETTLPELTEQHRIRVKEEELSGLESVHMAESETVCAAPGLNTLETECVTAHSRVSDVHRTHTALIKTEADLGSTHTGDLIKAESLDRTDPGYITHLHPDQIITEAVLGSTHTGDFKTESLDNSVLGYVTHLHPDQIKTEADDGGYLTIEHTSELQDVKCVFIKSDEMKCESSDSSVTDVINTVNNGAGVDQKEQTEPWQCAGEPNPNFEKESAQSANFHNPQMQYGILNHTRDIDNENNQTRIFHESANGCNKHGQEVNMVIEPMTVSSSKKQSFFQNKTSRMKKGEIHAGEMPYKCPQCEKCFSAISALSVHLRIHSGEKPYKCHQCGKCFSQKSYINIHQRIHSGEKPYQCPQCGRCFSRLSHLNEHQRIHSGEKPYKCTQCEKSFHTAASLHVHLRIHTGEKPHRCLHCGKAFSGVSHLNVHQRIHTGEKPYQCTQCGRCFSEKGTLNDHKRAHTGEKPHKCPQCSKCYARKSSLTYHQLTHAAEMAY